VHVGWLLLPEYAPVPHAAHTRLLVGVGAVISRSPGEHVRTVLHEARLTLSP